jgi:hypothetical protein
MLSQFDYCSTNNGITVISGDAVVGEQRMCVKVSGRISARLQCGKRRALRQLDRSAGAIL